MIRIDRQRKQFVVGMSSISVSEWCTIMFLSIFFQLFFGVFSPKLKSRLKNNSLSTVVDNLFSFSMMLTTNKNEKLLCLQN